MCFKLSRTLLFVSVALALIPAERTMAQEEGKVIIVSSKVGELIDRQERDTYRLFRAFTDFQSAIFYVLPDSTYEIHITYLDQGIQKTQVWRISKQEFLENYKKTIDHFEPDLGVPRELWKSPMIQIVTGSGLRFKGIFQSKSAESVTLINIETPRMISQGTPQETTHVNLSNIAGLSFPRQSTFFKSLFQGGLTFGAIGAIIGLASGDDPPGWFSFTAGEKATLLGLLLGCFGANIGGSIAALRGVDIDVPWEGMSEAEKEAVLRQVGTGQYHSRHLLRVSPWAGVISLPYEKTAPGIGGRLRYYLTPRSGLELAYGKIELKGYQEGYRVRNYFSGGCFISFTQKQLVNPFVAWGLFPLEFYGGVEMPLNNWVSLEGRTGVVGVGGWGFQLAFSFGPSF